MKLILKKTVETLGEAGGASTLASLTMASSTLASLAMTSSTLASLTNPRLRPRPSSSSRIGLMARGPSWTGPASGQTSASPPGSHRLT